MNLSQKSLAGVSAIVAFAALSAPAMARQNPGADISSPAIPLSPLDPNHLLNANNQLSSLNSSKLGLDTNGETASPAVSSKKRDLDGSLPPAQSHTFGTIDFVILGGVGVLMLALASELKNLE